MLQWGGNKSLPPVYTTIHDKVGEFFLARCDQRDLIDVHELLMESESGVLLARRDQGA